MQIDEKLIAYLEDLSSITLAEDEKQRFKGDLQDILTGMAKLAELDTQNVAERSHPFDNVNAFRDDIAKESLAREAILRNAPVKNSELFIAPKTVE
ncbi:MAG: Asp-tRNA(Asn)/Glu-tRNA(Gln) amidotransferase subunit GatC [Clostridiales bacterium]|nr:Asp-tRNA(Asn)/Glu-tRNA(Gln) amidotransferase subunit GatC [Clostridiales bacterium]